MNLKTLIEYAKARAKEQSTWLGIITGLGTLGVAINPAYASQIAYVCAGLFSSALIALPQK